jgi:hypothetical protein
VAHTSNTICLGGRDQEDCGFRRPYLEKTHHKKRAGGVAHGGGLEYKPQYCNNNNNNNKNKPTNKQNKITVITVADKIHQCMTKQVYEDSG